jgi:hypothetical protein
MGDDAGRTPPGKTPGRSADDALPSAAQIEAAESGRATHPREPHSGGTAGRLNWLRAGVLGANDGIVSVAAIVIGVAGATADRGAIFTAGLAGLVGGAVSMALGEYVTVSSQRDSERATIKQEKRELADSPDAADRPVRSQGPFRRHRAQRRHRTDLP